MNARAECNVLTMYTLQTTILFLLGFCLNACRVTACLACHVDGKPMCYDRDQQMCCKGRLHPRVENGHEKRCCNGTVYASHFQQCCDGIVYMQSNTSVQCVNGTTEQNCPHGSFSVNCSQPCHCLEGTCDKVTGACENGTCEEGWKGTACNETIAKAMIDSTTFILFVFWWVYISAVAVISSVICFHCVRLERLKRRRAQKAVQPNQLQSSNKPQVGEVRKYDMQVDTHNAEAKEEENDDNNVVNSLDIVI
ncbi:multiple epidermal growth factor-like domains protein 10 [Dreissena polymorpha]|uniref:multiple epidermal growth factor-like domains protein 10 n=1 Tax=Dreissena polymorpha TaxID=45954 RepID=UPI002264062E|nr:multiple epidermal growth factor-like domains protein 10 [Dreissena polymorpha]